MIDCKFPFIEHLRDLIQVPLQETLISYHSYVVYTFMMQLTNQHFREHI